MTDETPDATVTSITVTTELDVDPLLDHLGEFSDTPGPEERTIDREARGVAGPRELRYFIAAHAPDDTGNPESVEQDWKRMEAYGDEWHHVGVRAVASVTVGDVKQTIRSPGVYGIPSDAPERHHDEVARDELAQLRRILDALGLSVPDDVTPAWDGSWLVSGEIES